jgi:hypothetical protein
MYYRKVWYFAYRAPQLHILSDWDASRSELNSVFNSCSEAREVGQSLELDYFVWGNREELADGNRITGNIRNYVNLDIDTLWVTLADPYLDLPETLCWSAANATDFGTWADGRARNAVKVVWSKYALVPLGRLNALLSTFETG